MLEERSSSSLVGSYKRPGGKGGKGGKEGKGGKGGKGERRKREKEGEKNSSEKGVLFFFKYLN